MSDGERPYRGPRSNANRRSNHNYMERERRNNFGCSFVKLRDNLPYFQHSRFENRTKLSRMQVLKKAMSFIQDCRRGPVDSTEIDRIRAQQAEIEKMISAITAATTSGDFESVASLVDSHLAQKASPSTPSSTHEEDDDEPLEEPLESEDEEEDDDEATTESDESDGSGDNYFD